ncbi:RNA-directed DNA polymerase, eukaryota [Tanacetum coccineum]|uniref:RNA-directed DNA polymerase, eukaryota n=1 Tax=Tanacetum coccineum TaxID=301880 RepID=A0ABQ5JEZ0_9ASTR
MAYSLSSLPEVDSSSSLDSILAFKAVDLKIVSFALDDLKVLLHDHLIEFEVALADEFFDSSVGFFGGILYAWDPSLFHKDNSTVSDSFVAIRGTWIPLATKILIISIYAPQDLNEKRMLWEFLGHLIDSWEGECVLLGDFNEVRSTNERYGTEFNTHGANAFNNFISMAGLVELPLKGYSYTWAHKSASKMSKLDRFLISESLLTLFPSLSALCLDRHLSNHRPILMRELNVDYGPTPFRIFHSWFHKNVFDKMVEDSWKSSDLLEQNSIIKLKKKFQALKTSIKQWSKNEKMCSNTAKTNIQNSLSELDKQINHGRVDGDWVVDPFNVKEEFLNHFSNRFVDPNSPRLVLESHFPTVLSSDQISDLESDVSYEEIKKAVWDCGINKSPGPDGFTFEFFRRYWKIIDVDVVAAVLQFFSLGILPPGCNSSFIALIPKMQEAKVVKDFRPISLIGSVYKIVAKILANRLSLVISSLISDVQSAFVANRQILEGPFILNELLSWCKHKKSKAMIFKVDFEKAFDSIQGCLNSAMGSILINGSPTTEFKFYKGLKKRDPLSPFLFILIMESLHLSFKNVIHSSLYKGIQIDDSLMLSHFFYADDVVFVGKWDKQNVATIVNVLKCFFLALGLKINLHKSKLMGIGIPQEEVRSAAASIGCFTFVAPFNFLGVKVGGMMSRRSSWEEVIGKLSSRLSKWKLKTLCIGGRLTLIKSVLSSLPLYQMSIFKCPMGVLNTLESIRRNFFNGVYNSDRRLVLIGWNKILASKKNRGLGAMYGMRGALDRSHSLPVCNSPWIDIIREVKRLSLKDVPLKHIYPRLFMLELDKNISIAVKMRDNSLISSFRRVPRGGIKDDQVTRLQDIKIVDVLKLESFESLKGGFEKLTRNGINNMEWHVGVGDFQIYEARGSSGENAFNKLELEINCSVVVVISYVRLLFGMKENKFEIINLMYNVVCICVIENMSDLVGDDIWSSVTTPFAQTLFGKEYQWLCDMDEFSKDSISWLCKFRVERVGVKCVGVQCNANHDDDLVVRMVEEEVSEANIDIEVHELVPKIMGIEGNTEKGTKLDTYIEVFEPKLICTKEINIEECIELAVNKFKLTTHLNLRMVNMANKEWSKMDQV